MSELAIYVKNGKFGVNLGFLANPDMFQSFG